MYPVKTPWSLPAQGKENKSTNSQHPMQTPGFYDPNHFVGSECLCTCRGWEALPTGWACLLWHFPFYHISGNLKWQFLVPFQARWEIPTFLLADIKHRGQHAWIQAGSSVRFERVCAHKIGWNKFQPFFQVLFSLAAQQLLSPWGLSTGWQWFMHNAVTWAGGRLQRQKCASEAFSKLIPLYLLSRSCSLTGLWTNRWVKVDRACWDRVGKPLVHHALKEWTILNLWRWTMSIVNTAEANSPLSSNQRLLPRSLMTCSWPKPRTCFTSLLSVASQLPLTQRTNPASLNTSASLVVHDSARTMRQVRGGTGQDRGLSAPLIHLSSRGLSLPLLSSLCTLTPCHFINKPFPKRL